MGTVRRRPSAGILGAGRGRDACLPARRLSEPAGHRVRGPGPQGNGGGDRSYARPSGGGPRTSGGAGGGGGPSPPLAHDAGTSGLDRAQRAPLERLHGQDRLLRRRGPPRPRRRRLGQGGPVFGRVQRRPRCRVRCFAPAAHLSAHTVGPGRQPAGDRNDRLARTAKRPSRPARRDSRGSRAVSVGDLRLGGGGKPGRRAQDRGGGAGPGRRGAIPGARRRRPRRSVGARSRGPAFDATRGVPAVADRGCDGRLPRHCESPGRHPGGHRGPADGPAGSARRCRGAHRRHRRTPVERGVEETVRRFECSISPTGHRSAAASRACWP